MSIRPEDIPSEEPVEETPAPVEEITPEEPGEPQEEPEGEPQPEATYTLDGRTLTQEELRRFVRFADWAENNTELYSHLLEVQEKGVPQPTKPEPQQEPQQEWVDPDERMSRLESDFAAFRQQQEIQRRTSDQAALQDGITQFRAKRDSLTDEQLIETLTELKEMGILPTYRDLEKYQGTPDRAVAAALEAAFRNKFFETRPVASVNGGDLRRRRAAASVSPSSAPVAKAEGPPKDRNERIQRLTEAVQEAMTANE